MAWNCCSVKLSAPTPKPPAVNSQKPLELSTSMYVMSPVYLLSSMKPKSYEPGAPFLRSAVKTGLVRASWAIAVSKKVFYKSKLAYHPSDAETGTQKRLSVVAVSKTYLLSWCH